MYTKLFCEFHTKMKRIIIADSVDVLMDRTQCDM